MTTLKENSLALAALFVLLGLTVGAAFLPTGAAETPIALTISLLKAALILLVFMRIRSQKRVAILAFAAGTFWLLILIGLGLSDYLTRG